MGFWRTPQCFLKPRSFRFLCLGIWRGSFKPQKPVIEARVPQATLPHCPMRRRLRIVPLHADTSPAPPALSRWPTLWQLRGRPAAGAEASRLLPGLHPHHVVPLVKSQWKYQLRRSRRQRFGRRSYAAVMHYCRAMGKQLLKRRSTRNAGRTAAIKWVIAGRIWSEVGRDPLTAGKPRRRHGKGVRRASCLSRMWAWFKAG